jgi:Transglycosylase SLT domain
MADGDSGFDVAGAVTAAAQQAGVDPSLALGVANAESGMNAYGPASSKGAVGPMGLMPATAKDLGIDPYDPQQNIIGGVRYIKQLQTKYGGDPKLIAAAYNAGPGAVDEHGGVPPYPETQAYVQKVTGEPSDAEIMQAYQGGGGKAPVSVKALPPLPGSPDIGAYNVGVSGVEPPSDEVMKAYLAHQAAPAYDASHEAPVTVGGVAKQVVGGVGDVANSVLASLTKGPNDQQGEDYAADLGDVIAPQQRTLSDLIVPGPNRDTVRQVMADQPNPQLPSVAPPSNLAERFARLGGELLPGALVGPEGETSALAGLGIRAKNVLYPAITGTITGEGARAMNLPANEVSVAQAAGSIPGSLAAVPSALEGLSNVTGSITRPFMAAAFPAAREAQAGQILANAAGPGFNEARSALEGYAPLVPGSPATVGDVTGNLGLIGLSRGAATKGSTDYAALTGAQNQARTASLRSLSPNADPAAVRDHLQSTLEGLDARTQADVDTARTNAQNAAVATGGTGNPEDYGSQIRDSVSSALKASDQREAGLWEALKPYEDLTGNVTPTRLAAKNILGEMSQYDVPLNGDEQRIFSQATSLPDTASVKDVLALRKSINAAASQEFAANGATPTYARLSALRTALSDNLSNTLSDVVTRPDVQAKYQAWENAAAGPNSEVRSGTGGGNQQAPGEGAPAVGAAGGAALPAGSGSGSPAGTQGVSEQISPDLKPIIMSGQTVGYTTPEGQTISAAQARSYQPAAPPAAESAPTLAAGAQPTITPEVHAQMQEATQAANAATAEQAQTFRQGAVAPTLRTTGFAGQYAMPNGAVPGQFFKPGPIGYDSMSALLKASPEAAPVIQDYAASTLKDMALKPDGTIDPKGFARWQARYGDAIRALPPEAQGQFADAASATQTVADAEAARAEALKAAQSGAIGKVLGAQTPDAVTKTVGSILKGTNATNDIQTLVDATKNNPDALAGLKQAVIDHITNNYIGNTEAATTGEPKINADSFQTFLKQAQPALSRVFSTEEMTRLNNIAADIQQSQRTLNATKLPGQSNTAQDIYAGGLPGQGKPSTMLDFLGGALAGTAGVAAHGALGAALAEPVGMAVTDMVQRLRLAGVSKVNDLVREAVFDPKVAAALMRKVNGPQDFTSQDGAGQALLKALIAPTVAATATKPQPKTQSALEGLP